MKVIGLTGGIGMGKSTAAGFLLQMGVRVVDTDDLARQLVQPGQPALVKIREDFGKEILTAQGELRRDVLARMVFCDSVARQKLEAILHPLIRAQWLAQVESWRLENVSVAVVVIPLLFETQAESCFDKVVCIACSAASQHQRLTARGWSPDQIRQRIAAQMLVDQKMARSHYVVWSEGETEVLRHQLVRIIQPLALSL